MISMVEVYEKPIPVDEWIPSPEDEVFRSTNNAIILPISEFYGSGELDPKLDMFVMSKKKSYNGKKTRDHIINYLNYFVKFYDPDHEMLSIYYMLKILIDHEPMYTKDMFMIDLERYLMSQSIIHKVSRMVHDNYMLNLNYKNNSNPSLQYTNQHGKILMAMSVMMDIVIPIATHFVYIKNLDANKFLLELFNKILDLSPGPDFYNKLYNTVYTNVNQTRHLHGRLWEKQDIRGINITTHSGYCIENILLNIMPKYRFDQNIISFNFTSIKKNVGFQIVEIGYEFDFIRYSSSDRDDDFNSAFDKFESYQIVQNEGLYIQNYVNSKKSVQMIERLYGPFSEEEIDFYRKALSEDGSSIINEFQFTLISNLFFKYFGEPQSLKSINTDDYIKLMIAAKRILIANNLVILPYVISSKIRNIQNRKSINKKELIKLENSPYYIQVLQKYRSSSMRENILSLLATISSSEFKIIDFESEELHGKTIDMIPDIIYEEMLMYVLLV